MKNKLIFITGVANGGKTTTLKAISKYKRLHINRVLNIKDTKFYMYDKSNCDRDLPCWLHNVWRVKDGINLIGTFCIDKINEHCRLDLLDDTFVIQELKKLDVDVYFFILKKGRDDVIDSKRLELYIQAFGQERFCYAKNVKSNGDASLELEKFIESIVER